MPTLQVGGGGLQQPADALLIPKNANGSATAAASRIFLMSCGLRGSAEPNCRSPRAHVVSGHPRIAHSPAPGQRDLAFPRDKTGTAAVAKRRSEANDKTPWSVVHCASCPENVASHASELELVKVLGTCSRASAATRQNDLAIAVAVVEEPCPATPAVSIHLLGMFRRSLVAVGSTRLMHLESLPFRARLCGARVGVADRCTKNAPTPGTQAFRPKCSFGAGQPHVGARLTGYWACSSAASTGSSSE